MACDENHSRTQHVAKAMFVSLSFQIVSVLFPFIIRTLFIKFLGSDYLGLNGFCVSLVSTLNVVDLGIDAGLIYRLYSPIDKYDFTKVNMIMNYARKVYIYLGVLVLILALCVVPFLNRLIKCDIPENVNVLFVFFCFLLQVLFSYWFFNYYQLIYIANQRRDLVDLYRLITAVFVYSLQLFAVLFHHYYLYVTLQVLFPLGFGFLFKIRNKKYFPELKMEGCISTAEKKSIWIDTFSLALFKLRTTSRTVFDNTIISAYLGLVVLSYYNNYTMIAVVPFLLCLIINTSLGPSIGNFQVSESKKEIYHVFCLTYVLLVFFAGLFSVCFYELIQSFIILWIGPDYLLSSTFVVLLTFQVFLICLSNYFIMLRESLNIWNMGRIPAVIELVLNLVLNVQLTKLIGLPGIVLATVLTIACINIPTDFYVIVKKHLGQNLLFSYIVLILILIGCFISVLLIEYLMKFIPILHIWTLLIRAIISVVLTCSILSVLLLPIKPFRELISTIINFIKNLFVKE